MPAIQQNPLAAGTQLPGSGLAQFLQLRGRRVVEACGVLWHSVEHGMYMSLPHQLRFDPDRAELERFLWRSNITGVKYPSLTSLGSSQRTLPLHRQAVRHRKPSQEFPSEDSPGHGPLRGACRGRVSVAGRGATVEPRHDGPPGQNAIPSLPTRTHGNGLCWRSSTALPFERWGLLLVAVLRRTRLPAAKTDGSTFFIACRAWKICNTIPTICWISRLTEEIAKDPALEAVSMGYSSLVSTDGLHEYKKQLGYTFSPHNSVMVLHPLARPILTSWPVRRALLRRRGNFGREDQHLERISAVLRGAELASGKLASNGSEPHAA